MSESNIFGVKLKAPKGSRLVVQSQPDVSSSTSENGVDDSKDFDKESYKAIKASFQQQPKKTVLHSDFVNQFNQLKNQGDKAKKVGKTNKGSAAKKAEEAKKTEEGGEKKHKEGEAMPTDGNVEEELSVLSILDGRIKESRRRCSSTTEVKNKFGVELKAFPSPHVGRKVESLKDQLQASPEEEEKPAGAKDVLADDTSSDEEEECTLQRTRTILAISNTYAGGGKKSSSGSQREKPGRIDEEESEAAFDKTELQSLSKREKMASKCWHAVQEIMTSEKKYVDVLKILDEFRNRVENKIAKTSEEGVCIYQMNLFTILPQILMLNSHLLEEFQARISNWTTHKKIADVLVKKGDFLRIYSTYMDTFDHTSSTFQDCVKKYSNFAKLVKEVESLPLCQGLCIQGHMLAPVQRLPRYKMLLETYLKYQEENGEDFEDTKNAIRIVLRVTNASNDAFKEKEKMDKMKQLQKNLGSFELVQAARSLLKEGVLENVTIWEVPQPCHAILVTDSLLIACPKVPVNIISVVNCAISRMNTGVLKSATN